MNIYIELNIYKYINYLSEFPINLEIIEYHYNFILI